MAELNSSILGKDITDKVLSNQALGRAKFISSLKDKDALLIPKFAKNAINLAMTNKKEVPKPIYILLASAVFWPDYNVRKEALELVKNFIAKKSNFQCDFLKVVLDSIRNNFLDEVLRKIHAQNKRAQNDEKVYLAASGKNICKLIYSLMYYSDKQIVGNEINFKVLADGKSSMDFLIYSLLLCSLDRTVEYNGSIWINWIKKHPEYSQLIKSDKEFCTQIIQCLFSTPFNENSSSAEQILDHGIRINAVKLLVSLGEMGHNICEAIWHHCIQSVNSIDIQKCCSVEERDVQIYKTAEGVLFNTDVIEANADDVLIQKNLKRESKTYSYKEQLAEIEVRKELAAKNRREGKLSERQKKAVAEELLIEQAKRSELKELYNSVKEILEILSVAVRYNPKGAFIHIGLLYDVVVPLLKSKIVSEPAVYAFMAFRDAFFDPSSDYLHELVAHSSLRVLGSDYLFSNWAEEPLENQLRRTFALLSSSCFMYSLMEKDGDEIELDEGKMLENEACDEEGITAAKLAFLLPLVRAIFLEKNPLFDSKLKIRVAAFFKEAIAPNFILPDEQIASPMIRLNTILLDAILLPNSFEYMEDLVVGVQKYCKLLNTGLKHNEGVFDFIRKILSHFFENDAVMRRQFIKLTQNFPELFFEIFSTDSKFKDEVRESVYLASHDNDTDCLKLADELWYSLRLKTTLKFYEIFVKDLCSPKKLVREEAAHCLVDLIKEFSQESTEMLASLETLYKKLSELKPAEFDRIGRKIRNEVDDYEKRSGIANAIFLLADCVEQKMLMTIIRIVVPDGLNDRNDLCRSLMRGAAVVVIKNHGKENIDELLPYLEDRLDKIPAASGEFDNLRQGLIILIGTLARHLVNNDLKIRKIVSRLIEALSTPSQQVQESVANCLPALVPALKSDARDLIQNLLILLTNGTSYGERRGAAYGIASVIKGLGVVTIKEIELTTTLKKLLAQNKNPVHREGALLCIEMMCRIVGKLFEPYVVQLLPDLLASFGDPNEAVRQTADETARALMQSLSTHGVKLVLPSLLKALDEDSWRTKCASAELLGAMSYCAPRQLSASLPSIVPKLCEILVDTHAKVQKAGEKALKQIAQVIQNPEILGISTHLMAGLVDPASKTKSSLEVIVNTKFVHYVDSPSLALMMPIIQRAFGERNTETRKMAAQIIANIYSLADHKDMEPYLRTLVPGIKKAIVDPAPEVRTVASSAIGSIIKYTSKETSEALCNSIIPWLKESLESPTSMVDRSGGAQSLAEVMGAIGDQFVEDSMLDIIKTTENPNTKPHILDGYILLYIFLPIVLEEKFVPYIPQIVPSILKALANENEYVRDSALKAGQRLISTYVGHAKKLLLPQLQTAITDDNWRIRHASVKLIGEFLFNISGVSGKMTSDTAHDDDTMGMETVNKAIVRQIGQKARDEILASLYLARHDVALIVRQAASHVWKVVVTNTPRTVKDLMKTLFEIALECLSSSCEDRQQMAARCLGEMVKKMGERILLTILPILEERLSDENVRLRRGVALALNEIIVNMHRDVVEMYASSIAPPIRKCLLDAEKSVRDAVAQAFGTFQNIVGFVANEEIINPMLEEFSNTNNTGILDGLCAIISSGSGGSRTLFASLLPKLSRPPVNSLALCRLAMASEDALSRNLGKILEALLSDKINTDLETHIKNSIPVLLSLGGEDEVRIIITSLLKSASKDQNICASILLKEFIANTESDLHDVLENLTGGLIGLYNSQQPKIIENAIETLSILVKGLDGEELLELITPLKRTVNAFYVKSAYSKSGASEMTVLSGLTNPKGWQPLLTILRENLLSGSVEVKEVTCNSMGQLILLSDEKGLKPHVVSMAGPLIRVLGDRHSPITKLAVLNTLIKLLDKLPLILRPFLPQMQSVFLKILQEQSAPNIRSAAKEALQRLIDFHPKPEVFINELVKLRQNAGSEENATEIENFMITMKERLSMVKNGG